MTVSTHDEQVDVIEGRQLDELFRHAAESQRWDDMQSGRTKLACNRLEVLHIRPCFIVVRIFPEQLPAHALNDVKEVERRYVHLRKRLCVRKHFRVHHAVVESNAD